MIRLPALMVSSVSAGERDCYRDSAGRLYFTEMDSYYHVRLAENYADHGSLGNSTDDEGRPWDDMSYAPDGRSADYQPAIVMISIFLWKILGLFVKLPVSSVCFWTGAVVSVLAAIPAYFLGLRITNRIGAAAAALITVCGSYYVSHTVPGFYDTDMFVALCTLLSVLCITEALRAEEGKWKQRISWSAAFALSMGLYSQCWSQYIYYFLIDIVAAILYVLILLIARRHPRREAAALGMCAGFTVTVMLGLGNTAFFQSILGTVNSGKVFSAAGNSFPNVFVSIDELQKPVWLAGGFRSLFLGYAPGYGKISVAGGIGGLPVIAAAILAVIVLLKRALSKKTEDRSLMYFLFFTIWALLCLYGTKMAVRFTEHLAVPVAMLAGTGLGWTVQYMDKRTEAGAEDRKASRKALTAILFAAVTAPSVIGSLMIAGLNIPSVSDARADAAAWIKDNTPEDAVIASWWDYGYYYEEATGRACLFDGGSPSGLRATLVGHALSCSDQKMSERIIRMLALSGDRPVMRLSELAGSDEKALKILYGILPETKDAAEQTLTADLGFKPDDAAEIASLTHPEEDRDVYLVLSSDMLDTYRWIDYFGNWDFSGKSKLPDAEVRLVLKGSGTSAEPVMKQLPQSFDGSVFSSLFENGGTTDCFTELYEADDGICTVQVWKTAGDNAAE